MPRKLSDRDVARLRAMAVDGHGHGQLAREFGITSRHVGRLVRMDQRPTVADVDGPVAVAVRGFLDGLELDAGDRVLAAAAELLAVKLDGLRTSDSAAAAAAAPALVRQIGETLRELRGEREDVDAVRRMLEPLRRAA